MNKQTMKMIQVGAVLVILGILLSGPPMVFVIEYVKPQPIWVDAETFISHFHSFQTLPYWFGFLLLIGNVLFLVAVGRLPGMQQRIQSMLAMICVAIYGTLVSFNYAIQTTAIPAMVADANPVIASFSMANPFSICWTIEMFAYAILGVAYWLVAIAFHGTRIRNAIKYLMILNGVISILGILIPVVDPQLLLQPEGIFSYVLWNVLIVVIMVLILVAFRNKEVLASKPENIN